MSNVWVIVDKNEYPCSVGESAKNAAEMTTLCDRDWPNDAPHRAIRVVPAEEAEKLKEHLAFVERWANHHARKPHVTAEQALAVIQHYPPVVEITKSYADSVVPDTPDPWAEAKRLQALLARCRPIVESEMALFDSMARHMAAGFDITTVESADNSANMYWELLKDIDAALEPKT